MASNETIFRTIAVLCESFGRKPTDGLHDAYAMALDDIGDAELLAAVMTCIKTETFFPKPVRLRELCGKGGLAAGLDCVAVVRKAISAVGSYRSPVFEDPAISAAVFALGGWVALCEADEEEFNRFTAERLRKAYESFSARSQCPRERLAGRAELDPNTPAEFVLVLKSGQSRAIDESEALAMFEPEPLGPAGRLRGSLTS